MFGPTRAAGSGAAGLLATQIQWIFLFPLRPSPIRPIEKWVEFATPVPIGSREGKKEVSMFTWKRGDLSGWPQRENDYDGLAEFLLNTLRNLHSINKELKYSNWLKMIELKAKGLYDEAQLKQDLRHFGLES
ncbi:MAG: hypothetical protein ACYTHN_12030 [Planctomycetota bacterium]